MDLDVAVNFTEKNRFSNLMMILILGFACMFANLICLTKRMILPAGINAHFIFSVSGVWFKLFSYAFFGFISGFSAFMVIKLLRYKKNNHKAE